MEQEVISILKDAFHGIEINIEELPGERISGFVVWDGFAGLDHVDRQNKIRTLLKKQLGAKAQQVGVLPTYTPDELRAMNAA